MLLCITPVLLFAQYKNNIWLLGYDNEHPLPWGGSKLVFLSDTILISADNRSMELNGCFSGLSAQDDSWFVYTNGSAICNKYNDTLINGFGLSPGGDDGYRQGGFPIPGMSLIVPEQNNGNKLFLFHENIFSASAPFSGVPRALKLYYSIIDPTSGVNGSVILKNQLLIDDTLEIAGLTACRHANVELNLR